MYGLQACPTSWAWHSNQVVDGLLTERTKHALQVQLNPLVFTSMFRTEADEIVAQWPDILLAITEIINSTIYSK